MRDLVDVYGATDGEPNRSDTTPCRQTYDEMLSEARTLVETGLEIVRSDRREDGGWILWHDPNASANELTNDEGAQEFWRSIDDALAMLDDAGWLQYRGELVTVVPAEVQQ